MPSSDSIYYDLELEYDNVPQPNSFVAVRRPTPHTPPLPVWTAEHIQIGMDGAGVSEWTLNYILPGPYPMDEVSVAIEATRLRGNGITELKIFTFKGRANRNGPYLDLLQTFSEPEYVSLLRRRHRDMTFYYEAQQRHRRRLVAKVLAGGEEPYQLLLGPVVDDEDLRANLRSKKYKSMLAS